MKHTFRLDLDASHAQYRYGAVQVFLNWVQMQDGGFQPAYYFRKAGGGTVVAPMTLKTLARYIKNSGYPEREIVYIAIDIAKAIGFLHTDKYAIKNVADAILELTEDLMRMPGEPPADYGLRYRPLEAPNAHVNMRVGGEIVNQFEERV